MTVLHDFYERDADRFWDPSQGLIGRDCVVSPLLADLSGSLLEYGCGAGSLLAHLASGTRFSRVVGVDISEAVLRNIASKIGATDSELARKLELRVTKDDKLPFLKDGSIDAIVSVATIEHVLDPYPVLDELHRVARSGATLVCSVPNYAYIKHRISLLLGRLPITGTDQPMEKWREAGWDGMHLHCFTQSTFGMLLRDTGWRPVLWTGWGDRMKWLRRARERFPSLLSGELIARCVRIG